MNKAIYISDAHEKFMSQTYFKLLLIILKMYETKMKNK